MTSFFKNALGFAETDYEETRQTLLKMATIKSIPSSPYPKEHCEFHLENGKNVSAGVFSVPTVAELRDQVDLLLQQEDPNLSFETSSDDITLYNVIGEARDMHSDPDFAGSVMQAASQFNLLEFASPSATPELGIEGYVWDHTQGPACAVACAAGTAYRNYLVPVQNGLLNTTTIEEQRGQTKKNQLNMLQDVQAYLAQEHGLNKCWIVKNGYIESSPQLITPLNDKIRSDPKLAEQLISRIRIGVQENVTVTDLEDFATTVTQTYNSAVSIGYSRIADGSWEPFARVVLRATYEATLLVGIVQTIQAVQAGQQPAPILLTKVGGGVFRNRDSWIKEAIQLSIDKVRRYGVPLDIRVVHYGDAYNPRLKEDRIRRLQYDNVYNELEDAMSARVGGKNSASNEL